MTEYPEWFLASLHSIKGKRPRTVVDHILEHGYITTEELQNLYGYEHPPRAARDVRELGIPLETFRIKNAQERSIAAYRFGDISKVRTLGGREAFSKEFKHQLVELNCGKCSICLELFEERYLQIDHRIPYEIAGETSTINQNPDHYMLLCSSCNRAKSWSCEHCVNWLKEKIPDICNVCYWARPESYKHIALREERRLDITWSGKEVEVYEKLRKSAQFNNENLPAYVKEVLYRCLYRNKK